MAKSNHPAASIYDTIRQHDDESDGSDGEPGNHLNGPSEDGYHDIETGVVQQEQSRSPHNKRTTPQSPAEARRGRPNTDKRAGKLKWLRTGQRLHDFEDVDDDVPASLLIEGADVGLGPGSISLPPPPSLMNNTRQGQRQRTTSGGTLPTPPGEHLLPAPPTATRRLAGVANADPRERALYRWTNVINLDVFLHDIYMYYLLRGFWSMLLRRLFGLITVAFVVGFSLFLTQCVDYSTIKNSTKTSQILVPNCTRRMGFAANALLWGTTFTWMCKAFQYVRDIQRLRNLHDFYLHLLNVSDAEIQSIEWQEIVSRLMALRDSNPTVAPNTSAATRRWAHTQNKQRMDAHDIANRLMRRDNYMIAMINKDILDMTLPIPFLRNRQLFTRTLEWNLNWCVMDFVFNNKGQIRPLFLKETHRKELTLALRRRFLFAGTANLIIAPFLIIFILIQNFFTYFNEYQKNPSSIGTRQYSVFAEWKFREFNELWHLFKKRVNMSHPFASRYVDQFPKDKTIQSARLVTFISGAVISVLGLATIFDQENFLSFEITHGRTTLFYIGLFGGVWAVARGMIPEDSMVYDPAFSMNEVVEFTHYQPGHWNGRLHTVEVKNEFEQLYKMKILVFIEEILSMVFTPFVLWFSLPKCSDRIIDFFREFTVHVDGIGYVCSFAEFKLRKAVDPKTGNEHRSQLVGHDPQTGDVRDDYFASKDHKLEQSYWGFMNDYARNPKTDIRRQINVGSLPAEVNQYSAVSSTEHSFATAITLARPHHQPSASGFGGGPLGRSRTNLMLVKSSRRAVDHPADVAEEEEEMLRDDSQPPNVNQNELGSWKYDDESESSTGEDDLADKQGEMGVLGLIRQLQKTQGEGTKTGSGI